MIKTLVSIEVDLASSLAIRLACQLGAQMNMEIQPVYIKESPPHESVWGAGWASRTWEKEMVEQGRAEISDLLTPEQDYCTVLEQPRVMYGDKEGELLKLVQAEHFDIFIEGARFAWTLNDLYKRLHSRLYQKIPSPVILVRAFRKVNQVQLLCFDAQGVETLTNVVQSIWEGCPVPLVLNYPADDMDGTGAHELRDSVDRARGLLEETGCTVTVQDTLSRNPEVHAAETLKDCGLVAIAMERSPKKDCLELQWLSEVKTSSLLAFR